MEPGFRVGQYVFERPLGEGGMAEVWLARNVHIGNLAAVKFLNRAYEGASEIEKRFINEGQRQGALNHPNIIKVYGFEKVEGRSFLILQYVDGEPLGNLLERAGRLEAFEAARIGISVLNALEYAHEEKIVHRDVKPSNILLDKRGFPYLGDFGIVLAMNDKRLTRTGTTMGTALYMSPEQITRPGLVDGRSDIYSFGCVLCEMLTGEPPFNPRSGEGGDTDFAIKAAHVNQPPPSLRQRNSSLTPAVEAVVLRCLAKNPADRFATCRDTREALSAAMIARPTTPEPIRPPRPDTVIEIPPPETPPKTVPPPPAKDKRAQGGSNAVKDEKVLVAKPPEKGPVAADTADKAGKTQSPGIGCVTILVLFACLSRGMPSANPNPNQRANGLLACLIAGLLGLLLSLATIANGKRQVRNQALDPAMRKKWRNAIIWGWIFVAASFIWITDPNIWGIVRGWLGGK